VPETKRIAELFEETRRAGNQMTITIDEFGGIAGLVTTKSLLEEVVGRVGEEGFSPEEKYEAIDADTFQIDGSMSIDEATEQLGIEFPEGEYDTVAGFVLEILGHIPVQGEKCKYRNIEIEITRMEGLRVVAIKLTKIKSAAEME
jgi:putative hemolysin